MKYIFIIFLIISGVVNAEQLVNTAITENQWQAIVKNMPKGNLEYGKNLYSEKGCSGCHGEKAIPSNKAWPVIAGQRQSYIYKILLDYREKRLTGNEAMLMSFQAEQLTDKDISDLAAWLSSLNRSPKVLPANLKPKVLEGDHQRLLTSCTSCHGASGQGWDTQPALIGQHSEFLTNKLQCLKKGDCANDINGGMRYVASKLTDKEIQEISKFYGN